MRNDKRLAERIRDGDTRAFEEFVDIYGARVQRLVRQFVANSTDAQDVIQDIFVDLYRSIGAFRGDSALATWVYRVAVNHCLKYCKRSRQEIIPYDEQTACASADWRADPMQAVEKCELSDRVRRALNELPPYHHDVVVLCEMLGLTYQECAEVLEIPVGTVKSRLSTAFRRLRDRLGDYVLGNGSARLPDRARERPL
ncbi:MAG TPA: sigma-70 family RNA polymerase sigma factor [Chthonomonadaceae bacterium]|nr:sigma-70 family RNA polymerase sigma factor [Chthonomonadaceae bacterium]